MQTIFIHWHGPFSWEDIDNSSCSSGEFPANLLDNGLYAITGKCKYQREARLQYIGITKQEFKRRLNSGDHKSHQVTREKKIWLGSIAYKRSISRNILELAESMLIYFNDEKVKGLNEKKTVNPPKENCALISMFFKNISQEMYQNCPKIVRLIPEIIIWNKDDGIFMKQPRLSRRNYCDVI